MTAPVTIKRQNRKSLVMRVTSSGDVVVCIPHWLRPTHPQVKQFIKHGLARLDEHIPVLKPVPRHDRASVRKLVRQWSKRMDLHPKRISFRAMTRKWGSCSSRGHITLNTALFYLPDSLIEYVIAHELAHLKIFDHSPAFWAFLGQFVPDFADRERELNTHRV